MSELKALTAVSSEPEADMVIGLLSDAGIHALTQRSIGGPEWGYSGGRVVYVNEPDLERARAVLTADERPISDEELTRLSEQAGREAHEP